MGMIRSLHVLDQEHGKSTALFESAIEKTRHFRNIAKGKVFIISENSSMPK